MTRLLQSGLIRPEDLHRKYTQELFANEIVLLSYYIAAINIETVYAEEATKHGVEQGYVPFEGIALTDTFQLNETDGQVQSSEFFPENHERVKRQKNAPIKVIVMNRPIHQGKPARTMTTRTRNTQSLTRPSLTPMRNCPLQRSRTVSMTPISAGFGGPPTASRVTASSPSSPTAPSSTATPRTESARPSPTNSAASSSIICAAMHEHQGKSAARNPETSSKKDPAPRWLSPS